MPLQIETPLAQDGGRAAPRAPAISSRWGERGPGPLLAIFGRLHPLSEGAADMSGWERTETQSSGRRGSAQDGSQAARTSLLSRRKPPGRSAEMWNCFRCDTADTNTGGSRRDASPLLAKQDIVHVKTSFSRL
ncbi:unnamed protein product [Lota lota]